MRTIDVYWIDEHSSSKRNGIGTLRDMLLPRLSEMPGIRLTLISLNADTPDLEWTKHQGYDEISVPIIAGGNWRIHGDLIWPVLNLYIGDKANNVFMLNHSPCGDFIRSLKSLYPKSRITFTIHDQGWCTSLLGDSVLLREIIVDNVCPDIVSDETAAYVRDHFKKDLEIYDQVDAVVCLSASTEEVLKDIYGIPGDKLRIIPNGYEPAKRRRLSKSAIRKRLGLRQDEELLIFVGRPAKYKGIEPLLKALSHLRDSHKNMRCLFTGSVSGFEKFWKDASKVAPNIVCIGQVPHGELQMWYAAADVGIMPSYSEQCSYAALEMMASGLAVVSSDGNGLRDMFKDNRNAMVAHIENVTDPDAYSLELASAIGRALLMTNNQRRRMAAENRRLLCDKFSVSGMINQYYAMIQSIAGQNRVDTKAIG